MCRPCIRQDFLWTSRHSLRLVRCDIRGSSHCRVSLIEKKIFMMFFELAVMSIEAWVFRALIRSDQGSSRLMISSLYASFCNRPSEHLSLGIVFLSSCFSVITFRIQKNDHCNRCFLNFGTALMFPCFFFKVQTMHIVEFALIPALEDVIKSRIKLCADVAGFPDRSDVKFFRNLFTAFDTTKQGRITLDYNQFVYCGIILLRVAFSLVLFFLGY